MCHDWWFRRMREEREASRELWDDFERTRPLSDSEPEPEGAEIRLERTDTAPMANER